jgi:hypothetical protein
MIGVVSAHAAFYKAVECLLRSEGRDDILLLPPDPEQIKNRLLLSAPLILDAHLADASRIGKGGLTLIRQLRSDQAWRYVGLVLILTYEPAARLGQWPDAEVLDTKGITVLQMPFMAMRFQTALASVQPLSEAEWAAVHRRLGPSSLADRASKLGHDYENAFSQALSALRELEKLGAFLEPDTPRIRREIQAIRSRLTEERLSAFFADLRTLSMQAASLGLLDEACSLAQLDGQMAQVKQGLPRVSLDGELGATPEVFRAAHAVRSVLRTLLAMCAAVKEKATKEVKGGR